MRSRKDQRSLDTEEAMINNIKLRWPIYSAVHPADIFLDAMM